MAFAADEYAVFRAAEAQDLANGVDYSPAVRLRLTPLSGVEPKRVHWAWKDWIAAFTLNLLAGPEGVGKSTFLAWLSAEFTRGTLPGEHFGLPGAVLIAALEDDLAATLRPRMEVAGADLDRVAHIDGPDGGGLRLPEHLDLLRESIRSFLPDAPKLVIVDPIKGTTAVKTRDESEVRPFLQMLLDISAETGATFVGGLHFKKGARLEDFAAWKVSGDPAWTQVPRSVLFFDEDPEADEDDPDARLIAHAKCNLARRQQTLTARIVSAQIESKDGLIETSRMILGGVSMVSADDLGKRDREQQTAQGDAQDFLLAYLSDGKEHESGDVKAAAEKDGHSDRTIKRAARKLGVAQRREGSGASHRSLWSLTNDGPTGPTGPSQPLSRVTQATEATEATKRLGRLSAAFDAGADFLAKTLNVDRDHVISEPEAGGLPLEVLLSAFPVEAVAA
jgi:hypothetical protein